MFSFILAVKVAEFVGICIEVLSYSSFCCAVNALQMRLSWLLLKYSTVGAFQVPTAFQFLPEGLLLEYFSYKNPQLWYFHWIISCIKTHAKGINVAEIRMGMLIIVYKWICGLFIGSFLFWPAICCREFLLRISISRYCWVVCLIFSSLTRALEVF